MSTRTLGLGEELHAYVIGTGMREPPILKRLREETSRLGGAARMQISPEQGRFMALLVEIMGARRIVEVGTFTGYSSLACALSLPADGRMVCCDVSEEWTAVARRYWAEAGVADRIDLRLAPAAETLEALLANGAGGTVDLCFIDADKANYDHYYEYCLSLLRPGGVILIDNTLWSGRVIDPSDESPDTAAIRALNAKVGADPRVHSVLLPLGDGLTMARKR